MRAKPSDLNALTDTLETWLAPLYPRAQIDRFRIKSEIEMRLSSAQHFVARSRGSVLLSSTQEIPFAERRVNVIEVLGGPSLRGMYELLDEHLDWLQSRPVIRFAVFTPVTDLPPGMRRLLAKFGFERRGGTYQRWRK